MNHLRHFLGLDKQRPFTSTPSLTEKITAGFRSIFQRTAEPGASLGFTHQIKTFVSNFFSGKKQNEDSFSSNIVIVNVKSDAPHLHKPTQRVAPDRARADHIHDFKPGYLPVMSTELKRMLLDAADPVNQPGQNLQRRDIRDHIDAADRIHNSLWESFPAYVINTDLSLGEGSQPEDILLTLKSASKLAIDKTARDSLQVLIKSVSFYAHGLRQKNKTPGP